MTVSQSYAFGARISSTDFDSIASIVNRPDSQAVAVPGDGWEIEDGALIYRFGRIASILHYPEDDERSGDYIQFDESDGIYVVDSVRCIEPWQDDTNGMVLLTDMGGRVVKLLRDIESILSGQ